MSHKQILFALAKICCNAICAVPDRGRRKQSVTRTGDYPANPVDQSKGKYLMNDTFQKAMANAASEAKSQFETFSKAFDPLFNNEASQKAAESGAETFRAASESVQVATEGFEKLGLSLSQHVAKSVAGAFEAQAKMLTAGSWQAAAEIQQSFISDRMDAGFSELSKMTEETTAILAAAGAPLQSRFDEMAKAK